MSDTPEIVDEQTAVAEAPEQAASEEDMAAEAEAYARHMAWVHEAAQTVAWARSAEWTDADRQMAEYRGSVMVQPQSIGGYSLRRLRTSVTAKPAEPEQDAWADYARARRAEPRPQPQPLGPPPRSIQSAALSTVHSVITPQARIMQAFAGSTPEQPLFLEYSQLRNACLDRTWHPNIIGLVLLQMRDAGALTEVEAAPSIWCEPDVAELWPAFLDVVTKVLDPDKMKLPDGSVGYYDLNMIADHVLLAMQPQLSGVWFASVEAACFVLAARSQIESIWLDSEGKRPGVRPKQPEAVASA